MTTREQNRRQKTPEQRARAAMVFQVVGISDIGLGVLLAVMGPEFIGGDAVVDVLLLIAGIVLAVFGAGVWWYGRFRLGRRATGDRASSVVDRD